MSIYCSIFGLGDDHKPRCARMKSIGVGIYQEDDSKPCTCGNSPLRYQDSHTLPSQSDARGGQLGFAAIPDHITRSGRSKESGKYWPWIRFHLSGGDKDAVILTLKQVRALRDALTQWVEDVEK